MTVRLSVAAALLATIAVVGAPASAQEVPTIAPATAEAGPLVYGPPVWLPLRHDLDGAEIKVGCTFDSHGSQHGYECGGHHSRWALDFIAPTGTPVYAAGAGFAVDLTGKPGGSGLGNVVRIDHGVGRSTIYGHLERSMVPAEGAWVDQDTQIGTVGSTGSSSTPHLHFERSYSPTGSKGILTGESVDPGELYACRAGFLVSFPDVAGFDSWYGLPWGSLTVASDGTDCTDRPGDAAPATDADSPPLRLPSLPLSPW